MKPKIALIAGGYSHESEISLKSAKSVMKEIDTDKYDVYYISLTRNGWYHIDNDVSYAIDKNDFSVTKNNNKHKFDAAFIMIHGTPGEDGILQGYLDMLGVPYTTCNANVSALTFNKFFCNRVVDSYGLVKVAKSVMLDNTTKQSIEKLKNEIGFPCFIKPNEGGSSIGTSKVESETEILPALKKALAEDKTVLAEQFIKGREMTCGVISFNNKILSFPVTEIITDRDFFDYKAKYEDASSGKTKEITPADISQQLSQEIKKISESLYQLLNCSGVVRFDYIVQNEIIWFLEVNTVPGMSEASIVPKQAATLGISYKELTGILIDNALSLKVTK